MKNQEEKSNKESSKEERIWKHIIEFCIYVALSCALLVMWRLQAVWHISYFILCAIAFCFALVFSFRKENINFAVHHLLIVILGVMCGVFLSPKTEKSIIESFIKNHDHKSLMSVRKQAYSVIQNNIKSYSMLDDIAVILRTGDLNFSWRVLNTAYENARQLEIQRFVLNVAKDIDDERMSLLFEKGLLAADVEIILVSINYLQHREESKISAALKQKISFLLESMFTANPLIKQSISTCISVFLGREAVPAILEKLSNKKRVEYIDLLGRIGSEDANELLIDIIVNTQDAILKKESIVSLGLLRNKEALAFLQKLDNNEKEDSPYFEVIQSAIQNQKQALGIVASAPKDVNDIIVKAKKKISEITSYDFKTNCRMWIDQGEPVLVHEMNGRIAYTHKNKFLLDQQIILYQDGKQKSYIYTSFDGAYQWYYEGKRPFDGSKLRKIKLERFLFPQRPFDVWPVPRSGLMSGEDYLQTIHTFFSMFDFTTIDVKNDTFIELHGNINKNNFMKYYASMGHVHALKDQKALDLFSKTHSKLILSIRKKDYVIIGWKILSNQQKAAMKSPQLSGEGRIEFQIEEMQINPKLTQDIFTVDAKVAEKAKSMESNLKDIFDTRLKNRKQALILIEKILHKK